MNGIQGECCLLGAVVGQWCPSGGAICTLAGIIPPADNFIWERRMANSGDDSLHLPGSSPSGLQRSLSGILLSGLGHFWCEAHHHEMKRRGHQWDQEGNVVQCAWCYTF